MSMQDWMLEYAASNYLRETSDEQLQQRYESLTGNLWSTGQYGDVTPPRSADHRRELLRLVVHVLCERSNRTKNPSIVFNEADARQTAAAAYRPIKLRPPFVGSPDCFAKFGKRDHIRNSFENGVLRIAPGSAFNDPSLNAAQRDNELEHWTRTPNEKLMMKFYGLDDKGNEVEIPVRKQELLRGMNVPDFYVWCCGLGYDARLFHEFKADAVLVVRDKDEFRSRLAKAMESKLPGSAMQDRPLAYYDPYTIQRHRLFPIFNKNLRYLHQNEYRFAWTVPKGTALEPIYVTLGPLTDIAEFYKLTRPRKDCSNFAGNCKV